jgi:hypothetical protein
MLDGVVAIGCGKASSKILVLNGYRRIVRLTKQLGVFRNGIKHMSLFENTEKPPIHRVLLLKNHIVVGKFPVVIFCSI